ncbi:MAG: hypothetical protein GY903_10345 [Fuerstiella sp.]|nr:hypothetical protein [Fuerstiella sp.]MCP4854877.1 hypothetical protein [Fuerstiella sp.]
MVGIQLGINMEFVRSADKPFAWGVARPEMSVNYLIQAIRFAAEVGNICGVALRKPIVS